MTAATKQNSKQIISLLDDIQRLNNMISLHEGSEHADVMTAQYQRLKKQYIADLEAIMTNIYHISFGKNVA
jgi:uncharacterized protein YdcH (DUF465 family)